MTEYTPTTEEIREYVEVGGQPRPWEAPDKEEEGRRAAAFDRWLAAHDAEVAANAWDQGRFDHNRWIGRREDADAAGQGVMVPDLINPYRADRIEREATNHNSNGGIGEGCDA